MSMQLQGYVCDIPYDNNFYKELTPNFLESLLLLHGLELPYRNENEPFRYLELGYGQGLSLNVHAAANDGEFWGTDFNPNHCLNARAVMRHSGTQCQVLNDSFEELAAKIQQGLLPQFDMIVLHGVWSWITKESREAVLQIISKSLKVGGLVYVSYNCMPGWASFTPLRELLTYHAKTQNASRGSVSKVQQAYGFISQLEKAGAMVFTQNPSLANRFKALGTQSVSYVAHEYFNEDWYVPYFKDVATDLEQAKCTFFTSTRLLNQHNMALSPDAVTLLQGIEDVKLRETVRDFVLNTQFRSDVFVKGTINGLSDKERLLNSTYALCVPITAISYTLNIPSGKLNLKQELYEPLVHFLAEDNFKPKSIAQMQAALAGIEFAGIVEMLSVFLSAGYIHPTKPITEQRVERTKRLNSYICTRTINGLPSPAVLASPVLGSGVFVLPFDQFFLFAMAHGHESVEAQAAFVQSALQRLGRKIKKDDVELNDEQSLAALIENAEDFAQARLPLLQALQVHLA